MKKIFISLLILSFYGCMPGSFVRSGDGSWSSIEIREGLDPDQVWNNTIDLLARRFELEMINKDSKYARTGWIYNWNIKGSYMTNYRVRATIKFSADGRNVDVKSEAQYGREGAWRSGFDDRLLSTLKADLSGVIGRTTF